MQCTKQYNIFIVLLCFVVVPATAQFSPYNLVPNPSFEQYTNCPYYLDNINARNDKPDIWYKPDLRGARFFHACANGYDNNNNGMPVNFGGGGWNFQYTRTGLSYMLMFFYNGMDARNYIQVELLDSLQQGKCYYAEYYINSQNSINLACNNQAMLFTNNPVYVDTANNIYLLPANPQIQNPYIVTDTLNWVKVAGVFTAQGGEKYLTLGNFKNNAQTTTQPIQLTGYNGAAYYIEDVSVLPLDSITLQADAGEDKTITAGDSTFIGSFTTGLTNVTWYNSAGNVIATNVSGLYVQPASSTYYVIEQNVCGQYSTDTVYITVGVVPLRILNFTLVPLSLGEGLGVRWTTANEINVSHFNIQRSSNGMEFYAINKINAKNESYNEYNFTDLQPLNGTSYYRIESIDKDGKTTYSKIENIQFSTFNSQFSIFPNPATNIVNIVCEKAIQQVTIIDVTGRVMLHKQLYDNNKIQLNVAGIGKGVFIVKVTGKDGNIQTQKLIIQ